MTGKQLKNSILQWAIQGKLVPQDPNDEPASVLLEKIRQEKERLIKEKKIKRDKNASIIYRGEDNSYYEKILATGEVKCIDEEIPFEVPKGWEWCRIKHLFSMQAGKNIKAFELSIIPTSSHTYPCYGGNGLRGYVNRYNTEGNFILVGRQGALCGNVKEVKGKFYATEHAVVTDGYGLTHLHWAYYFMWAIDLNQYATATAQPGLAVSNIIEVLIPLPPHEEQIRIASKIDDTIQYIESFAKAQNELEALNNEVIINLRKSILQEAIQGKLVPQDPSDEPASILLQRIRDEKQRLVKEGKLKKKDVIDSTIFRGDDNKYYENIGNNLVDITDDIPFEIPNNWVWTRIGYLFAHNNGKQLNRGNSAGTLMEYITTSNLYWDGFRLDHLKMMPFEESEIERCQAIKGDLLVCEGGDVGRSCIWDYDFPIMIQNHIHKLRPYIDVCTKFFYYIFYLYNVTGVIGGKGIGIQGFSAKALHNTLVPLPPLQEQQRIVAQIERLFEQLK